MRDTEIRKEKYPLRRDAMLSSIRTIKMGDTCIRDVGKYE